MAWGPWIEHDGAGCPVPVGTLVQATGFSGRMEEGVIRPECHVPALPSGLISAWFWDACTGHPITWSLRIVAYRVWRSASGESLIQSIRDMAPEAA